MPDKSRESHTFDKVYGMALGLMVGVFVWTAFDVHNRLPLALGMQAVILLMRVFWKRRGGGE